MEEFGLTQEQVGRQVSRSRPAIANSLRLLDLAPEVQRAIEDGTISAGHGRALAGVADRSVQLSLLAVVTARSLSVRETERLVADRREPFAAAEAGPSTGSAPTRTSSTWRDGCATPSARR